MLIGGENQLKNDDRQDLQARSTGFSVTERHLLFAKNSCHITAASQLQELHDVVRRQGP